MNVLENFKDLFDDLVDMTYDTYWDQELYPKNKSLLALHGNLKELFQNKKRNLDLTKEEIEQQLALLWLGYDKQYYSKKIKPTSSIKGYLTYRSIWGIRDWLKYELNILKEYAYSFPEEDPIYEFKLDLNFLIKGVNYNLLANLSPYERYLIFLKFNEDKNLKEIAKIVQKDSRMIKKHLNSILYKLKETRADGL